MVGAGISVSSGYMDFRTPESGLFSNLKKYNFIYPEQIFEINYFKLNPDPFYTLYQDFIDIEAKPSLAHHFIANIYKREQHLLTFSQNFDSLEYDAGLPIDQIIQAHGHMRLAHCTNCDKEYPISLFNQAVKEKNHLRCQENFCNGLIKPQITFFGENMPKEYFEKQYEIHKSDLIIVMGTSLQVFPFASLLDNADPQTPIVLINREDLGLGITREKFLFLQGEIDTILENMYEDLEWTIPK